MCVVIVNDLTYLPHSHHLYAATVPIPPAPPINMEAIDWKSSSGDAMYVLLVADKVTRHHVIISVTILPPLKKTQILHKSQYKQ